MCSFSGDVTLILASRQELLKCAQRPSLPSSNEVTTLQTVINQLEVSSLSYHLHLHTLYSYTQDLARYINSVKGDSEDMKQIVEVEESFSEPLATPLLQCGRYRLDGELRVKVPGESGNPKK